MHITYDFLEPINSLAQNDKKKRNPELRKQAIISAAAYLILTEGLNSLTHRKIAAKAGVSLGSTTAHFSSLNSIIQLASEFIVQQVQNEVSTMVENMNNSDRPELVLAQLLHETLEDHSLAKAELSLLIANLENPQLQFFVSGWYDATYEQMLKYTSPEGARAVVTYCDGIIMQSIRNVQVPSVEQLASDIKNLMRQNEEQTAISDATSKISTPPPHVI